MIMPRLGKIGATQMNLGQPRTNQETICLWNVDSVFDAKYYNLFKNIIVCI